MAAAKRVTKVKSVNCILAGLVWMSAGDGLITSCSEWGLVKMKRDRERQYLVSTVIRQWDRVEGEDGEGGKQELKRKWYLYAAHQGMRCHGMSPRPSTPSQTRDEDPVEFETRLPRRWAARGGTAWDGGCTSPGRRRRARYELLIIPGSRHAIPTAYACCTTAPWWSGVARYRTSPGRAGRGQGDARAPRSTAGQCVSGSGARTAQPG